MGTTNVKSTQLNYDKYTANKYDRDIVNSIPFHREIHSLIASRVKKYDHNKAYDVLDLGVGTAITSRIIKDILPKAEFDLVDFSKRMLTGAQKKMGKNKIKYIFGDYAKIKFNKKYDIVVSVIGVHHQNEIGKRKLFQKIYGMLKPGGIFIFGDLVTYRDKHRAALNNAKHFKHLVDKATDEKTLAEWAYHHIFLNDLSPIEDQIIWLKRVGFKVEKKFLQFNTALLICKK
ncbi:MAG: class I SAM-dependent methyltransferase [Patescibacteria group bacterium]|nr:class I SAM-dependent methyltransferase [Patescibacteria group bacterium]